MFLGLWREYTWLRLQEEADRQRGEAGAKKCMQYGPRLSNRDRLIRQDGWGGADGGDGGSGRSQASRCGLKKLKISIHGWRMAGRNSLPGLMGHLRRTLTAGWLEGAVLNFIQNGDWRGYRWFWFTSWPPKKPAKHLGDPYQPYQPYHGRWQ